jgi:hypothetical protein
MRLSERSFAGRPAAVRKVFTPLFEKWNRVNS